MMNTEKIAGYMLVATNGNIIDFDENYHNYIAVLLKSKRILHQHGIETEIIAINVDNYEQLNMDYDAFQNGKTDTWYHFTDQYDQLL